VSYIKVMIVVVVVVVVVGTKRVVVVLLLVGPLLPLLLLLLLYLLYLQFICFIFVFQPLFSLKVASPMHMSTVSAVVHACLSALYLYFSPFFTEGFNVPNAHVNHVCSVCMFLCFIFIFQPLFH